LDQLRTVGPNSHLARLRGQPAPMDSLEDELRPQSRSMLAVGGAGNESGDLALGSGDGASSLSETNGKQKKRYPSFEQREYGKDSRPLSAVLHACAQAVDKNGIGTMWQGRENGGYLHEDSLRLLTARRLPKYHDTSIPGMTARQIAMSSVSWDGEDRDGDFRGNKRKSRKFEGLEDDDDVATDLDHLDEQFSRMYVNDDGTLKEEYRRTTPEDIWRAKYPDDKMLEAGGGEGLAMLPERETEGFITAGKERAALSVPNEPEAEMYFDHDTMKWQTRSKEIEVVTPEIVASHRSSDSTSSETSHESDGNGEVYFDTSTMTWATKKTIVETQPLHGKKLRESMGNGDRGVGGSEAVEDREDEFYFDSNEMRWKTRSRIEAEKAKRTGYEAKILYAGENEKEVVGDEDSEQVSLDRIVRGTLDMLRARKKRCCSCRFVPTSI
jgi:hypothetical protein